jgi:hypothetical protein
MVGSETRKNKTAPREGQNPNPNFHSVHTVPCERERELRVTTVPWEPWPAPVCSVAVREFTMPAVSSPVLSCGGATRGSAEGIDGDAFKIPAVERAPNGPYHMHKAGYGTQGVGP